MSSLQSLCTTSIAPEPSCRFLSTATQSRLISHLPLAQRWISYGGVPRRIRRSFCTNHLSEPPRTDFCLDSPLESYLQACSVRGGHDTLHLGGEMLQNIHAAMMRGDLKMMVPISWVFPVRPLKRLKAGLVAMATARRCTLITAPTAPPRLGKSWGREVAAQRETKYMQCFHDCPIMESSSTLIIY